MDAALTMAQWPLGRAGHAAARNRTARAEIEPLVALLADLAALGALLFRHGTNARTRTQAGGDG